MSVKLRPQVAASPRPLPIARAAADGPDSLQRAAAPRRVSPAPAAHRAAALQAAQLRQAQGSPLETMRRAVQGDFPAQRAIWSPLYQLFGKGSADHGGWALREGPPTRDRTATFDQAYAAVKAGTSPLPADASDYTYLVVPGFLGEQLPTYMDAHVNRLRERGLTASQVGIDTEAGVEVNARQVRDAILEASRDGRKVVLLGHSKGGLDITAALSLYPELKEHVRAVTTMQTPYGGTPLASDAQGVGPLRWLAGNVLERLGGSGDSLRDLTYEQRQAFLAEHPYPSDIPTVSLASSEESLKSVFVTTNRYMSDRYGWASDGLVPTQDQLIPGSDVVMVKGLDHAEAGIDGPGPLANHKASDLTEALIAVALQTARPSWMREAA